MKTEYVILIIIGVAFIWQLQVCFSGKPMKKKTLPGRVLLGMIAGLALFAVAGTWLYELGWPIYSAPYAAGIFAILLALPLAGVTIAWAAYGIVKSVQKSKK